MPSTTVSTCLVCKKRPKRKDYQFCSKRCTDLAAKRAPQLLRVPQNHIMYQDMAKSFRKTWDTKDRRPAIARMYLLTWKKAIRTAFDLLRDNNGKKSKEVKRFCAETRLCRLGDPGKSTELCRRRQCHLCRAIATSFKSATTEHYSRGVRSEGYACLTSKPAVVYWMAKGDAGSKYKAVLVTRAVLGKKVDLKRKDKPLRRLDPGCYTFELPPGGKPPELFVHKPGSVLPAYLLILK